MGLVRAILAKVDRYPVSGTSFVVGILLGIVKPEGAVVSGWKSTCRCLAGEIDGFNFDRCSFVVAVIGRTASVVHVIYRKMGS